MLGKSSTVRNEPAPVQDGLVKKNVNIRRLPICHVSGFFTILHNCKCDRLSVLHTALSKQVAHLS